MSTKFKIFKRKPKETHSTLKTKFEGIVYKIVGGFLETKPFNHALSKGEEREIPLINFLKQNLPSNYSTAKGEVIDLNETSSPQLDVMLYDSSKNIPFYSGEIQILPAEALLASIEVKSRLTRDEIKKILISVNKLKSLKPFKKDLDQSIQRRDENDKVTCRYFHTVFAYETDISQKDWAKKEFDRIKEVAKEIGVDYKQIDRVIVLNRGLLNPTYSIAKESTDNAEMLLVYYIDLLNYLQRENNRRKIVPYQEYAGKMSHSWIKL
nr:DUF6602 domain-containing protein [uncultured Flavobacterium sp.]